jgi:hypothetical protein
VLADVTRVVIESPDLEVCGNRPLHPPLRTDLVEIVGIDVAFTEDPFDLILSQFVIGMIGVLQHVD